MVRRAYLVLITVCVSLLAACGASSENFTSQEGHGQQMFITYCASCHTTTGDAVIVGPSLAGIATRAETRVEGLSAGEYIKQSILDPGAYLNEGFADIMPKTWGQVLSEADLNDLVSFLLTLK